jgi:archaellum biogenesis ATPase FlaH
MNTPQLVCALGDVAPCLESAGSGILPENLAAAGVEPIDAVVAQKACGGAAEPDQIIGNHPLFSWPNGATIDSGIPAVDAVTGGFGFGDLVLVIGVTGVGKTVLACQLATTFALGGHPGMLVTTEQAKEELEPRIYSNFCDIPFDRIKDGVDFEKLSTDQQTAIEGLEARLNGKLEIADWGRERSKSIVHDLQGEVRGFKDQHSAPPQWLILDWIGGALGDVARNKLSETRQRYENAAVNLARIAREENIVLIAFTQASVDAAKNNPRIDASCAAECKTMESSATTVIGISGLEEDLKLVEGGALPYRARQYLWVSKSDRGTGLIAVARRFENQRFESWDGNPGRALT